MTSSSLETKFEEFFLQFVFFLSKFFLRKATKFFYKIFNFLKFHVFSLFCFTFYEFNFNWQFVTSKAECFACNFFRNASYFKHNLTAFNWSYPTFRSTFTRTHTYTDSFSSV
ncbi:Uncharacterised protein [Klebsiella pneumoniae]|nr:Uncharacterised protein [Klebsiella pneumoniae]